MKAQHSTTVRSAERVPSVTIGFTRNGDPAEVCIAIAYGYREFIEEMDLRESSDMRAVISLGLYVGGLTGEVMTKSRYRALERAAKRFRNNAREQHNQLLAGFVLRQALARALKSGVIGKRSRRAPNQ
jgi:hypothetical protein